MNGLLNGSATQSQLDMFASRAGEPSHPNRSVLPCLQKSRQLQVPMQHSSISAAYAGQVNSVLLAPSIVSVKLACSLHHRMEP